MDALGSIGASGPSVRITNRSEQYRVVNQFAALGIARADVHCCKDIRWEIDDDISAVITWILAFHDYPHGINYEGKVSLPW
jgi:hypothetical protein